jgi:hypothetical protein
MPNLTEEEKREFPREIIEIMDSNSAELTAAGFDPAALKVELTTLADDADAKEAAQVNARAANATATAESQAATTAGYQKASDSVELIVGLLGKDHALSVILRQLRSE